ncbi:MAG: hypothetical protein KIS78_28845 [Labilithrix sp.]|nr:hypothetical protein [Labilithrix sp.]
MRFCVCIFAAIALGCAPRQEDVTPAIEISPGVKGRIMWMDRLRHHGEVRRWLPRVTVEEVDDAELPPPAPDEGDADDEGPSSGAADGADAGVDLATQRAKTADEPP